MRQFCIILLLCVSTGFGQQPISGLQIGREIPEELDAFYRKGLAYLALSQTPQGNWTDNYGQQPGVVGLTLLAFLASGEDPNYGPYRDVIRKGTEFILTQQDAGTGYIGNSMYNHGFATLALAELYGHLQTPDVGSALQKALDLILKSQEKNSTGAWRYTTVDTDADTTLSGAQMVALYASKNAGLRVPEEAFERAMKYYQSMTGNDGGVGYSGGSNSGNTVRTAISSLIFSLYDDYESATSRKNFLYLRQNKDKTEGNYPYYQFYYLSQALFQGDMSEWQLWNQKMMRVFEATQTQNGSLNGQHGVTFSTSTALLAMALNYRLMPIYER